MSSSALRRASRVLRLSYSQILRLRRCPWAWHAQHVRKLVPLRRRRPPPVWGDAYHAAAAAVWTRRARFEQDGTEWTWLDDADGGTGNTAHEEGRRAALARLRELDVPGIDAEALAAEVAQAAVEVCAFVPSEWRVLWLGGEPVVERRLVLPLGEVSPALCADLVTRGTPVELLAVLDLALVHADGRVRVVDHKTTSSWPEEVGDALSPDEPLDIDLRDDFQVRLYVLALRAALRPWVSDPTRPCIALDDNREPRIEGAHLVRRASVGTEPPATKRGALSLDKRHEYTEEQLRRAIRRLGLCEDHYEEQFARARLARWQAWGEVTFTERSLEQARREVMWAAEDAARYGALEADDVPRFHRPSYWRPSRPMKWGGCAPKTGAECHHWDACQACDHRELCEAELQGDADRADLLRLADFAHAVEERETRSTGADPSCELDADEV